MSSQHGAHQNTYRGREDYSHGRLDRQAIPHAIYETELHLTYHQTNPPFDFHCKYRFCNALNGVVFEIVWKNIPTYADNIEREKKSMIFKTSHLRKKFPRLWTTTTILLIGKPEYWPQQTILQHLHGMERLDPGWEMGDHPHLLDLDHPRHTESWCVMKSFLSMKTKLNSANIPLQRVTCICAL